jgi:hypothetical protein
VVDRVVVQAHQELLVLVEVGHLDKVLLVE